MKKQIDPGLDAFDENEEILLSKEAKSDVDYIPEKPDVAENTFNIPSENGETQSNYHNPEFSVSENLAEDVKEEHHHHHHSDEYSSGEHHHHSDEHHHHHHHHHKHKKKKPLIVRILLALLTIILIFALICGGTFVLLENKGKKDIMTRTPISADMQYSETVEYGGHTYKYNDNIATFAFIGVDKRDLGKEDDHTPTVGMADADIILAVDTSTGKASVIPIPRDTMVDVDVYKNGKFIESKNMELCIAYAYGDGFEKSCENVLKSMSRTLYNIPIDKFFALDLNGIAPINDAIGGVNVTSLYDFTDLGIKQGDKIHLQGDLTEVYVRRRDMDNVNASLERSKRQIQYINAFSSQLMGAVKSDFSVVSNLYNTASEYSTTNISMPNVTYLATLAVTKNITSFKTYSIKGEMKEVDAGQYADYVYAGFYPDEDSIMETVLDVFYTQVK